MNRYEGTFRVDQMACVLGVSRSGYYAFKKRPQSRRRLENEGLLKEIRTVFKESQKTYGSPRIHASLLAQGIKVSRPRVARMMKAHGLKAKMYKRRMKRRDPSFATLSNRKDLVRRNFHVPSPNRVWVADFTYLKVGSQWAYLAVVLDLFSRKIVGMALEKTMHTDLILKALTSALVLRKPRKGLIHHSDKGSQYTSIRLYQMAQHYGINLSYGNCAFDNAVVESFFHTLKTEHINFKKYRTLEEAKLDLFSYIFTFYNAKRRHSTLNYLSPNQMEKIYNKNQNAISVHSV